MSIYKSVDKTKKNRIYIAIDLKSFYASVECNDRGLDPLTTNLVVADASRTNKTICLAVTPSLKSFGLGGRARLFEVVSRVNELNKERNPKAFKETVKNEYASMLDLSESGRALGDGLVSSININRLKENKKLLIDYIVAPPRMATYMKYSQNIYKIYLRYVSPEDIIVYSIDEVFIDITSYIHVYKLSAKEIAMKMIKDVLKETGITATCGIGTNLYLAKIAMDVEAKKMEADENGVRIACLDEISYRKKLWNHKPITDFWRVGKGTAKKLHCVGLDTMGDIARCSLGKDSEYYNEKLLYDLFGINAELLIDHAWGYEPVTMKEVKSYRPENNSLSSGQVLSRPYEFKKARVVLFEMLESLSMDLLRKELFTDSIILTVDYDAQNLDSKEKIRAYKGEITTNYYGKKVPKHAHGTIRLEMFTNSTKIISKKALDLYDKIVDKNLTIKRFTVAADHIISEDDYNKKKKGSLELKQISLFDLNSNKESLNRINDEKLYENIKDKKILDTIKNVNEINNLTSKKTYEKDNANLNDKSEDAIRKALLSIRQKYGNNAIFRASSLKEEATARERNRQVGGHKA